VGPIPPAIDLGKPSRPPPPPQARPGQRTRAARVKPGLHLRHRPAMPATGRRQTGWRHFAARFAFRAHCEARPRLQPLRRPEHHTLPRTSPLP